MLHKVLRLMRVFYDLTQKELAEKLEISKSYLSEIESGKKQPSIDLLNKYSKIFDIPVSSILFFSEHLGEKPKHWEARQFVSSKILAILDFVASKSDKNYVSE